MWFQRQKPAVPPEIRPYYQPRTSRLQAWALWAMRLLLVAAVLVLLGLLARAAYHSTHTKHSEVIQTVPKIAPGTNSNASTDVSGQHDVNKGTVPTPD